MDLNDIIWGTSSSRYNLFLLIHLINNNTYSLKI